MMDWFAYDYVMNSDDRLWELIESIDIEGEGKISQEMCERAIEESFKGKIVWNEYFQDGQTHTYEEFAVLFRLDSEEECFLDLSSKKLCWSEFSIVRIGSGSSEASISID